MKTRVAIWMPGGVGGGYYSQGIPVISKLVDDLSVAYIVSIYSLYPANADFKPRGYAFITINTKIKWGWLRWIFLSVLFMKHHLNKRYDLLYAFWGFPSGFIVVMLSKMVGIPSIIHLQGGDAVHLPSINYGSLKGVVKNVMILSYHRCSVLIALTQFQKDKLIEAGVSRHIEVIPFGPDSNLFKRKETNAIHQPVRFLHIGNLLPVKDQVTLLNSFALISKSIAAKLRIIGEDHLQGTIQHLCRELNLQDKVEFLGIQPYEQMPVHYIWADVLLMTSVYEGQCLAVSEAAASGVLVAGTCVGLLSDWGKSHAIVVDIGDADRLATEVMTTVQNSATMHRIINQAYSEVELKNRKWTFDKIRSCIDTVYNHK